MYPNITYTYLYPNFRVRLRGPSALTSFLGLRAYIHCTGPSNARKHRSSTANLLHKRRKSAFEPQIRCTMATNSRKC